MDAGSCISPARWRSDRRTRRISDQWSEPRMSPGSGSAIIHHFAIKSSFFMLLGARRLKKRILVLMAGLLSILSLPSCGSYKKPGPPSGLTTRVLASQGVSSTFTSGRLVIIDGFNDTLARVSPPAAGSPPGLMAISPTRNIAAAFDASANTVYAVDTTKESAIGSVHLAGPTTSMALPTASPIGYAAVPSAAIQGFTLLGAIEVMNFSAGGLNTIAVNNAQTVIANSNGTQLLVFSNDSDSVTVLVPVVAVPPVDTSCFTAPNAACIIVPGFDRPVFAIVSGSTAYILNCGPQCGGKQASVMVFDLTTL